MRKKRESIKKKWERRKKSEEKEIIEKRRIKWRKKSEEKREERREERREREERIERESRKRDMRRSCDVLYYLCTAWFAAVKSLRYDYLGLGLRNQCNYYSAVYCSVLCTIMHYLSIAGISCSRNMMYLLVQEIVYCIAWKNCSICNNAQSNEQIENSF